MPLSARRVIFCTRDTLLFAELQSALESVDYAPVLISDTVLLQALIERDGLPLLFLLDLSPCIGAGPAVFNYVRRLRTTAVLPLLLIVEQEQLPDFVETARQDRVDFMLKPLNVTELLLRLERLAGLGEAQPSHRMRFMLGGTVAVDFHSHLLGHGREAVTLSERENILLYHLVVNANRTVLQETLERTLWNESSSNDHKLRALMVRLRRKLRQFWEVPVIERERGVGYRIVLSVERLP